MAVGSGPQHRLYRFESDTGVKLNLGQLSDRIMYESAKLIRAVRLRHCPQNTCCRIELLQIWL